MESELPEEGRRRVVIESVAPRVDGGRFPIKRVVGEEVVVEADAFTDSHDRIRCLLRHRRQGTPRWHEVPMHALVNDRWRAAFRVENPGRHEYTVTAWVDHFLSWRHDLERRVEADDLEVALLVGTQLVQEAAERAEAGTQNTAQAHPPGGFPADAARLRELAATLAAAGDLEGRLALAGGEELSRLMERWPDRRFATEYPQIFEVVVDPVLARFGAWYELFPRSTGEKGQHGTFRDCQARLPYVAGLGFDILYLPPIHPIGRLRRKGPNNNTHAGPDDPGSPWAIGADEGGHLSIHPELGTLEDFRALVAAARDHGLELALDIAFQCAPDHPWVKEHPDWFRHRPDGSVQYAENPPKKYQDIYPLNFESEDWRGLWRELEGVFRFWIAQGVSVFRVDNPHTKSFPFWEWVIARIKRDHPQAIFLSEAFTRPRVLHRLAKLGFTQSYNYFPWRNTKYELTEYLTELTQGPGREYLRPNLWPNTPDILPEYLQFGGRAAFIVRFTLAATLGASYGIYGPAFELMEREPREPGSEEYLDSEKYQIRAWDLERPDSLRDYIALVNRIRRENPALQSDWSLRFHATDNEQLLCYSKTSEDGGNVVVTVVNLDPFHRQSGHLELPLAEFGIDPQRPYQAHDLLTRARYLWSGARNYVELDPGGAPAHIFRLRRRVRREHDFDYFM